MDNRCWINFFVFIDKNNKWPVFYEIIIKAQIIPCRRTRETVLIIVTCAAAIGTRSALQIHSIVSESRIASACPIVFNIVKLCVVSPCEGVIPTGSAFSRWSSIAFRAGIVADQAFAFGSDVIEVVWRTQALERSLTRKNCWARS
jgi:hypothetical protein